jgi:hypothetical protein
MLMFLLILFAASEKNKNCPQLIPNNKVVSNILGKNCTNHTALKVGGNRITFTGISHNITVTNRFTKSKVALLSKANNSVTTLKTIEIANKGNHALDVLGGLYAGSSIQFLKPTKIKLEANNTCLGNTSYKI